MSALENEDKIIFNAEKAQQIMQKIKEYKPSLCIVVPTRNRHKYIQRWIDDKAADYKKYNTDLLFVDSSINDKTKEIVENCGFDNVHYAKYDDSIRQFPDTLDEKAYYCFKILLDKYDAIWPCRDRSMPNMENIYGQFCNSYYKKDDFIVIYPNVVEREEVGTKRYTDCIELMQNEFGNMTSLASVIYFKDIHKDIVENYPVQKNVNVGMWVPTAIFHSIANKPFSAKYLKIQNCFKVAAYTTSSFWLKNKSAMTLWVDKYPQIIENLPSVYNTIKHDMLTFKNWCVSPFSFTLLLHSRAWNDFSFPEVYKRRHIFKKIAGKDYKKVIIMSLIPTYVAKNFKTKKYSPRVRFVRFLLREVFKLDEKEY